MVVGAVVMAVIAVLVGVGLVSSGRGADLADRNGSSGGTATGHGTVPADDDGAQETPAGTIDRNHAVGPDRSGEAEVSDHTIQMGMIQREYLVARPSWATAEAELPLVVALHGLTVDRWAMLSAADWRTEVQRRGFIAVFPQGLANSWNSGSCCPPSSFAGTDDVGFIDSVISAVESSEPVDRRRVHVTGFSNGGVMAYRYGCASAADLAAIAPMAGSNLEGCKPEVPLSLFHQHSDPDPVVPYDGGFGVGQLLSSSSMPSVPDSVTAWAEASACGSGTAVSDLAPRVTVTRWNTCPDGTRVELVRLEGRGHEWPRTKDYDGLAAMLDFFGIS